MELKLPPIPVEQLFAQVQEQLSKVSSFLPALNRDERSDDNSYRGIFKGLLMETHDGFNNAVEAWKTNDYRRLAWATRSLVELKLWTKYVLISRENALALSRESDVDASNLWNLFKPILNTESGRQLFMQVFPIPPSEFTTKIQQHLDSAGLTGDEEYMRLSQVARDVGLAPEYKAINTTLSKFVHATGLSILIDPVAGRTLMPLNCVGACQNTKQILDDIQAHLPKVGLPTF